VVITGGHGLENRGVELPKCGAGGCLNQDAELRLTTGFFNQPIRIELLPHGFAPALVALHQAFEDREHVVVEAAKKVLRRRGPVLTAGRHQQFFANFGRFFRLTLQGEKKEALGAATESLRSAAIDDCQYAWTMAQCFSLLGEKEEALRFLQSSIDHGLINHPLLAEQDPFLEGLRGSPEFDALMADTLDQWQRFEV